MLYTWISESRVYKLIIILKSRIGGRHNDWTVFVIVTAIVITIYIYINITIIVHVVFQEFTSWRGRKVSPCWRPATPRCPRTSESVWWTVTIWKSVTFRPTTREITYAKSPLWNPGKYHTPSRYWVSSRLLPL